MVALTSTDYDDHKVCCQKMSASIQ